MCNSTMLLGSRITVRWLQIGSTQGTEHGTICLVVFANTNKELEQSEITVGLESSLIIYSD